MFPGDVCCVVDLTSSISVPFLCLSHQGPYDSPAGFVDLDGKMTSQEAAMPRANRMFFLSIPPNVFIAAAGGAADHCSSK